MFLPLAMDQYGEVFPSLLFMCLVLLGEAKPCRSLDWEVWPISAHFCSLMQWIEVCQRGCGFKIRMNMLKFYP